MKTHWQSVSSCDNCSVSSHSLFLCGLIAYYYCCLFNSRGRFLVARYIYICMVEFLFGGFFKHYSVH